MAANQGAVTALLQKKEVEHFVVNNSTGWCVEVGDPISGKDLDDLIKLVDTQANVIACVTPNVGLTVQTASFEYPEEM